MRVPVRASITVVGLAAVSVVIYFALIVASNDIPGLPSALLGEMVTRTNRGDSEARNLLYVLSTLQAVIWYEDVVLVGLSGAVTGFLSTFWPLTRRQRLAIASLVALSLLAKHGVMAPIPWFGAVLFTVALLGGASLREKPGVAFPRSSLPEHPAHDDANRVQGEVG